MPSAAITGCWPYSTSPRRAACAAGGKVRLLPVPTCAFPDFCCFGVPKRCFFDFFCDIIRFFIDFLHTSFYLAEPSAFRKTNILSNFALVRQICTKLHKTIANTNNSSQNFRGLGPLGRPWRTVGVQSRFFAKKGFYETSTPIQMPLSESLLNLSRSVFDSDNSEVIECEQPIYDWFIEKSSKNLMNFNRRTILGFGSTGYCID